MLGTTAHVNVCDAVFALQTNGRNARSHQRKHGARKARSAKRYAAQAACRVGHGLPCSVYQILPKSSNAFGQMILSRGGDLGL
jgi:hypothetical protein